MTDKVKTIKEALAEVQRHAEQKKAERIMNEWETVDENLLSTLAKGVITAGKNFGRNFVKGTTGSTTNVTRSSTGTFASPGAASKTGEAIGKGGKILADNPGKTGLGVGAVAGGMAVDRLKKDSAAAQPTETPTTPSGRAQRPAGPDQTLRDAPAPAPATTTSRPSAPRQSAPAKPELDISAQKDRPGYGAYWGKHDVQTEDGLKKGGKKKVSESALINAFFELHSTKTADNVFEAAKKLSAKQKKIAKLAGDPDEIEAEDLAALRAGKK